jgi:hypothetical protein
MNAEEILAALTASNPDIAKAIEALNTPQKKKRGRPKKIQEEVKTPVNKDDEERGIFRPGKKTSRKVTDPNTGEIKTLTRVEEIDLSKIKSGENYFTEDETEKDKYYLERPKEKNLYKSKLVERNRTNSLIRKTCEECGKKVQVPSICGAASYYRCDECLLKKKKNE